MFSRTSILCRVKNKAPCLNPGRKAQPIVETGGVCNKKLLHCEDDECRVEALAQEAGSHLQRTYGKGSHQRAYLNGKVTIFPNHPSKEIPTGTVNAIKRDLGLK
jgi:mRNA interferase HicA